MYSKPKHITHQTALEDKHIRIISLMALLLGLWIIVRLVMLQIIGYSYYSLFAQSAHEIYQQLHPERGQIYFTDLRTGDEYPAAINKQFYRIFAVPKAIPAGEVVATAGKLANFLSYTATDTAALADKLSRVSDSYRAIAKKIPEELMTQIKDANLTGVYFTPEEYRYYPEDALAGPILGFASFNDAGFLEGKYGLEGYWDKKLAGRAGFVLGEKGMGGSWIATADKTAKNAENGPDLLLTIDRALENKACERLRQGMVDYEAKSASLVLMDPSTGAILAMCSMPDFDPNLFSKADLGAFNNTSIYAPYEPGSVFKAITMAIGLDLDLITPNTTFTDPCELIINGFKVHNALNVCYGLATMTQVLENSINTGAVWVEKKIGQENFAKYVKNFGFGAKTGITLNAELAGDISSLDRKGEIFGANGSFGQGFTATPIQIASAYAAIANGGKLMKPYIVAEARYSDGRKEKTNPQTVNQVISPRAAKLAAGMLVSVVEKHYHAAQIPHYYVAGKTGTAQISEKGAYSADRTNHTFAGFAPADNPRFVLIVKYEEPQRKWAEQTALPVFKDVMQFALDYAGVPGDK